MDPLSAIGVTASIAQLVDLADKTAASAWTITRSIIHAPVEVARLAEKLERFRILAGQVLRLTRTVSHLDEVFPNPYRDIIHSHLQCNIDALENLKSLSQARSTASMSTKGRIAWATVDKKKAKTILEDLRDAESAVDAIYSMVSIRIASINQVSIGVIKDHQEMLLPKMMEEFNRGVTTIKERVAEQNNFVVSQIKSHTEEAFKNSKSGVQALEEDLAQLIQTVVTTGMSHSDDLHTLSSLHSALRKEVTLLSRRSKTPGAPPAKGLQARSREYPARRQKADSLFSQSACATSNDLCSGSNPLVSTEILRYELTRTQQRYNWYSGALDQWSRDSIYSPRLNAVASLTSSQTRRRLRIALRVGLRIIQQRLVHLEFSLSQNVRQWVSIPRMECSLTIINFRPASAPIFRACHDWDLGTVRYLLETGQASIHDVDDETRRGLLEHVFRTLICRNRKVDWSNRFRGHAVIEYLLDMGYNPNIFNGLESLPAVLVSFATCCFDLTYQLMSRGADLESFGVNPSSLFNRLSTDQFYPQYRLLKSIGFSDWEVESYGSLLHAACDAGDWRALLFALEVVGLSHDLASTSPLIPAACHGRVAMGSALIESGVSIDLGGGHWNGTAIRNSAMQSQFTMSHFFLYYGADINLTDCHGVQAWLGTWNSLLQDEAFDFPAHELLLSHLLIHGANPFEPAQSFHLDSICGPWRCNYSHDWYSSAYPVRSFELARAWSFSSKLPDIRWPSQQQSFQGWYEDFETDRRSRMHCTWSCLGSIYRKRKEPLEAWESDESSDWDSEANYREYSEDDDNDSGRDDEDNEHDGDYGDYDSTTDDGDNQDGTGNTIAAEEEAHWTSQNDYNADGSVEGVEEIRTDLQDPSGRRDPHTLFFENISTREGRRLMSTFPAVQLLCKALIRAGNRAEMDHEGDIWFEDSDGDMYYDAREYPEEGSEGSRHLFDCYICRDLRKYGLGEVLDEIEYGKLMLHQYRAEVKAGKRKWHI